jgi:hypothetical protein
LLGVLLLLIPGLLATQYFFRDAKLLEKTGLLLFFSLVLVPFVNINCALLNGRYVAPLLTLVTSVSLSVLFVILIASGARTDTIQKAGSKDAFKYDVWILLVAGVVGVCAGVYYTNKEFVLSLGSYLIKGDAECFYQQTFRTIKELNPDFKSGIPVGKVYEIICTPANILFTSTNVVFFKLFGFKITYIVSACLLFIFVYLIVDALIKQKIIALCSALWAVCNPYILSVEVLDRNIIALTISAVLFYLILEHKNKVFLHGLVFGILSGTGLRFLPLVFIMPVIMLYCYERKDAKAYAVFIAGFVITFAFNVPHLFFNGLHSLGETESSLRLIREMCSRGLRTPFLPFPTMVFYMLNILNYFGYLFFGIIIVGGFTLYRTHRKLFAAFLFLFLSVLSVLSYQRNWIEADKCRIILTGFLPLYVFFAYGLKRIFTKGSILKKGMAGLACVFLPMIVVRVFSIVDFGQDAGFYKRKYLYQQESVLYYEFVKKAFCRIGAFPEYERLWAKTDVRRKAAEERLIFGRLFPEKDLPRLDTFKDFYFDWRGFPPHRNNTKEYAKAVSASYDYIELDFDKLVTDLAGAVKKIEYPKLCAIDFSKKEGLFDLYYADLNPSWQTQPLAVSVMVRDEEIKYLHELNIDLNAFAGFGKDEAGFETVNAIHFKRSRDLEKIALESGMGSFPLVAENNRVIFCLPKDLKIIIRNWFINEKGAPYKVDSWVVKADALGVYRVGFFYNEPETYL